MISRNFDPANFKLKTKQFLGFGIILIIMAGANIFTITRMASIKKEIDEVITNWMPRAITISDLNLNTSFLRINQLQHGVTFDQKGMRILEDIIISLIDEINDNIDTYEKLKSESEEQGLFSRDESRLYENFHKKWEKYQGLSFEFFRLSREIEKQKAIELINGEALSVFDDFGNDLKSLVTVNQRDSFEAAKRAEKAFMDARKFTLITLIITILISLFIATLLVRLTTEPIVQLQRAAGYVSRGDLDVLLDIERKDEIGILASSFKKMTSSLKEARKKTEEHANRLKAKNEELELTMKKLQETQGQLIQSEKMASLGQLTAGVAHEINNPLNFVMSNVKPLNRDIKDLMEILEKYESIVEKEALIEKFDEINHIKEKKEYSVLIQEINDLLSGIEEGGRRTGEIVRGLRNFSRMDEAEKKLANINEGIESTLLMLHNEFKNRITVEKKLGDIPGILCYPGKLNQVFMNILSNAGHAIKGEGKIYIQSSFDEKYVYIKIKDTGQGMTKKVKDHIFEPFFTTKDVGKGTGLGLSITYGIIQDHSGEIEVKSELGKGSEFVIKIPRE